MKHPWKGNNSKSINELGMKYRPIEKSAIAHVSADDRK